MHPQASNYSWAQLLPFFCLYWRVRADSVTEQRQREQVVDSWQEETAAELGWIHLCFSCTGKGFSAELILIFLGGGEKMANPTYWQIIESFAALLEIYVYKITYECKKHPFFSRLSPDWGGHLTDLQPRKCHSCHKMPQLMEFKVVYTQLQRLKYTFVLDPALLIKDPPPFSNFETLKLFPHKDRGRLEGASVKL